MWLNTAKDLAMRAYELYETAARKPHLTVRHLNRLKHIRKRNQQAHAAKMTMLRAY